MKVFILCLTLLLCSNCTATEQKTAISPELFDNSLRNLNNSTQELILNGEDYYKKIGFSNLRKKMRDEFGTQLWAEPIIEEDDGIVNFYLKAFGIYFLIIGLDHIDSNGMKFKYWVVQKTSSGWGGDIFETNFFLSQNKNGENNYIYESNQFESLIRIEGTDYSFNFKNIEYLYYLSAWKFPENYQNTELSNFEIVPYKNNQGQLQYKKSLFRHTR
ncbi:hypothetical protein [Marinicellulosiphila megalodicopiae]|uniref:hypothetical protein n=1 Tax=Marinicellulosiphila megalodicopiae TaxID=2724896 RepID=UPI003BB0208C